MHSPIEDAAAVNLRIEVEQLSRLVAQLIERNGNLKADEIAHLREMIRERREAQSRRRNMRIYTGYFAAAVIFFYTIREYVALFWAWLKATLK